MFTFKYNQTSAQGNNETQTHPDFVPICYFFAKRSLPGPYTEQPGTDLNKDDKNTHCYSWQLPSVSCHLRKKVNFQCICIEKDIEYQTVNFKIVRFYK